jgi:hypothetical protein
LKQPAGAFIVLYTSLFVSPMEKFLKLLARIKGKLGRKLLDIYWFGVFVKRYFLQKKIKNTMRPSVWLDIHDNYERHTYLLAKLFELEGYQVIMRPNIRFLFSFGGRHLNRILTDNTVLFSDTKPPKAVAVFSDRMSNRKVGKFISKDYFSTIYQEDVNSYHIPIGLHPSMYGNGLWNSPIDHAVRKRSVFFAGQFNESEFKRPRASGKFNMPDRIHLHDLLKLLPNASFPKSQEELVANSKDGQIDIVEKSNFTIPNTILRQTLAGYSFFIACPGVSMPLSHNIYEGMSVGTIPIIHRQYADMFHPPLTDYNNAILFDDDNFIAKMEEVVAIDQEKINAMVTGVTNYYNANLTPKAIVRRLMSPKASRFFLNAERASVREMKQFPAHLSAEILEDVI